MRPFILSLGLLALLPVFGQTADTILVGSVRLKLGMSRPEVLTALAPYEVRITEVRADGGLDYRPCEGESVVCNAAEIGQTGKGTIGTLIFRGNVLVQVIKTLNEGREQYGVELAQKLYSVIAMLVSERRVACSLDATTGQDVRTAFISCGERTIAISLPRQFNQAGLVFLEERLEPISNTVPTLPLPGKQAQPVPFRSR
jgi:hypothetical protein